MARPNEPGLPSQSVTPAGGVTAVAINAAPRSGQFMRRISWGAVLAGAILALATQIALSLLGAGIGLHAFDPTTNDTIAGFGLGGAIWWVLSGAVALFVGGWVAGRLAGIPDRIDGALHGVLAWGVTLVLTLVLIANTTTWVAGGAFAALDSGMQLAGSAVSAVAPRVAEAAEERLGTVDLSFDEIRAEAMDILRETEVEELQPGALEERVSEVSAEARAAVEAAATSPREAASELDAVLEAAFRSGREIVEAADKEAVVNVLVARSDLSESEARSTVNGWAATYQEATSAVSQAVSEGRAEAIEMAESASGLVATASLWTFFAVVVGALVAGLGAMLGSPDRLVHDTVDAPAPA